MKLIGYGRFSKFYSRAILLLLLLLLLLIIIIILQPFDGKLPLF
jgi:hypothetical protein